MSEYEIRPYRPEDRDGFLSLYRSVMGDTKNDEWFDWKYKENPYVDHVPMVVALDEGTVVGARPLLALPMVVNGEREVAFQPGDAMVHADHRRQGIFSRMMEETIDRYSGTHPFYFSFPNKLSGPAHIKHGSRVVSERRSYYRIENPAALARSRTEQTLILFASALGTPVVKGYYQLRDLMTSEGEGFAVRIESEPPTADLTELYRTAVPNVIHASRDERFYSWRLNNPDWEYTTYLADGESGPEAAIVAGTSVSSEVTVTKLTDVVPLKNAPESALETLINRILSEHSETDLFVAPPQGVPYDVLTEFGFRTDTEPPLSWFTSQTTHVVRTLSDGWTLNGTSITDPDNWLLTFVEEDTS